MRKKRYQTTKGVHPSSREGILLHLSLVRGSAALLRQTSVQTATRFTWYSGVLLLPASPTLPASAACSRARLEQPCAAVHPLAAPAVSSVAGPSPTAAG
ncbi:hypothetical protein Lal_00032400 [Lupinus albus]|nr:hypothetical protein Lal_00032400 [Lupinus albus]